MIGGQSGKFRGKRRAAEVRQLVGMQLDRQSKRLRRTEHSRRLLSREGDAFHEGVDRIGKPGLRHRRQHLVADKVDVPILVAVSFRRQCVRAKKRGSDA